MKRCFSIIALLLSWHISYASCNGRFVNPITDVCWSCIFPISIGSTKMGSNKRKDTPNPKSPICGCKMKHFPYYRVGITIGFWEPIRLVDVVRQPYCMTGLGGMKLPLKSKTHGGLHVKGAKQVEAFYHAHMYYYPLASWFESLANLACMDTGSFDVMYMSELDFTWNNDSRSLILNPEALLFSSPPAQAACAGDCLKTSMGGNPTDSLFWCAGCQGGLYPFTGTISHHLGGVQSSTLVAQKLLARMHRVGLGRTTSSSKKPLCHSKFAPIIKKSQYKLQMTYPKANVRGDATCNFFGDQTMKWGAGAEYPGKGEDFSYLVWRKRNCCAM
jgi:conjugal transfer pilus assembly protein TraU